MAILGLAPIPVPVPVPIPIYVRVLLPVLILIGMVLGASQPAHALDSTRSLRQFQRQVFHPNPGEARAITSMAQTADGYLWIGTITGLYRFDGFEFEHMTELGGHSIAGRPISFMRTDRSGGLWIGYYGGAGAGLWHRGTYTSLPLERGWNLVTSLTGTYDDGACDELWAVINRRLVRVRDLAPVAPPADESVGEGAVRDVLVDGRGTVWVSMASGDDLRFRLKGEKGFRSVGRSFGAPMLSLAGDTLLAAGTQGLFAVELQGLTPRVKRLSRRFYWQVLVERGGAVVAAGRDGLRRAPSVAALISSQDDVLEAVEPLELSSPNATETAVWQLLEDRDGNLWAGTGVALERFRDSPVVPVRVPGTAYAYGVAPAQDGHIWAANWNSGLLKIRAGADPVTVAGTDASISALWRTARGELWVAGPAGLWSVDDGKPRAVPIPEQALKPWVAGLSEGADGELWLLASELARGSIPERRWELGVGVSASPAHQLRTIAPDGQGGVWAAFGTQVARLARNRNQGSPVAAWDAGVGAVQSLASKAGRLWIGGLDGLALKQGDVIRTLHFDGAPAFRQIVDVLEVSSGDLWVRGTLGAWRIPRAVVEEAWDGGVRALSGEYFDAWDGLDGVSLVSKAKLAESSDGLIWFGTSQGVAWLDPKRPRPTAQLPAPVLRGAWVDGEHLDGRDAQLVLPSRARHLELRYTAIALQHPERVRFKYFLEGFESRWQDVDGRRVAYYNDLPPGDYRFRLKTVDGRGLWPDGPEVVVNVRVNPAWYQSLLFRTVLAGAALAAFVLAWRIQSRLAERRWRRLALEREAQKERVVAARQAERNRIARELHDTLLQGVYALIWKLQAVAERLRASDPVRHDIDNALRSAELALERGRAHVQALRSEGEQAVSLLDELEAVAQQACEGSGVECLVSADGDAWALAAHLQSDLLAIAAEAVRNACRHGAPSRIELLLVYRCKSVSLVVLDDGRGIPDERLSGPSLGHWGLVGMRERALQMGGVLKVSRRAEGGTLIELVVPSEAAGVR